MSSLGHQILPHRARPPQYPSTVLPLTPITANCSLCPQVPPQARHCLTVLPQSLPHKDDFETLGAGVWMTHRLTMWKASPAFQARSSEHRQTHKFVRRWTQGVAFLPDATRWQQVPQVTVDGKATISFRTRGPWMESKHQNKLSER